MLEAKRLGDPHVRANASSAAWRPAEPAQRAFDANAVGFADLAHAHSRPLSHARSCGGASDRSPLALAGALPLPVLGPPQPWHSLRTRPGELARAFALDAERRSPLLPGAARPRELDQAPRTPFTLPPLSHQRLARRTRELTERESQRGFRACGQTLVSCIKLEGGNRCKSQPRSSSCTRLVPRAASAQNELRRSRAARIVQQPRQPVSSASGRPSCTAQLGRRKKHTAHEGSAQAQRPPPLDSLSQANPPSEVPRRLERAFGWPSRWDAVVASLGRSAAPRPPARAMRGRERAQGEARSKGPRALERRAPAMRLARAPRRCW